MGGKERGRVGDGIGKGRGRMRKEEMKEELMGMKGEGMGKG